MYFGLKDVDFVLHQAALGSVPRSISDPFSSNEANITGFLNMLISARDSKIKNFIYAGSSSTYGDHEALPKVENVIGKPKNPYSITKFVNELYADTFAEHYNFKTIGLRYFNVFGPRQRENGDYAAVIPKWIKNILNKQDIEIYGDGEEPQEIFALLKMLFKPILVQPLLKMKMLRATYIIFLLAVKLL